MPKVSLPFYKDGAQFQPQLTIKDLAAYEDAMEAAKKANRASLVHQAYADVIAAAIRNDDPQATLQADLPVRVINKHFIEVYRAAQDPGDADPLVNPGGSAPPF